MRKKKLAILLLGFIAAASCAIGLAACDLFGGDEQGGSSNGGTEHTHTYAREWSYDVKCHWHECIASDDCDAKSEYDAHTFKDGVCIVCDYEEQGGNTGGNTGDEENPTHTHSLAYTAAKAATCTESGNIAYWYCEDCGKYFSDEDGENEIEDKSSVILPIDEDNHDWGDWETTTEPTCTEKGEEKHVCTHDSTHTESREIATLPHTYEDGVCEKCGALEPSEGLAYTLSADGTYYTVSGIGACTDTDLVIADEYEGLPVTSIGARAFYNCTKLESVTIGSGVTSIRSNAFYNCTALTKINYNATECDDLSYDNYVFSYAGQSGGGITVNIGANVTKIPACLFYPYSSSSYSPKIVSVKFAEESVCTSIGYRAFYNCTSLTSVNIPDGVTNIGNYAFRNCSSFTSIEIPDSVTNIGNYAFYGCSSLESIEIPDGVTSIGDEAFYNCSSLTSVTIGNDVTSIGRNTFYGCTALESVTIGSGVTGIGDYAFSGCRSLTSIEIPDGVTGIGSEAFYNCASLTSITIPNGVTSIGERAFWGCTSLTGVYITDIEAWCKISFENDSANPLNYAKKLYLDGETISGDIELPNGVLSIPAYTFYNSDITSITIPDSVTSIGWEAFSGCTSLESVTIGSGVTSIGYDAFYNCTSLESIEIPNSVTSIGSYAFYNCTALTEIHYNATECANLSNNNYVFYNAGQDGNGITVNIGANVKKIPSYLFYPYSSSYSPKIVSVKFAENSQCESIGDHAFHYCTKLTGITIPDGVTSIGNYAFHNCTALTDITIPDGVTSIGSYAFSGTAYYKNQNNWENKVLYIGKHLITAYTSISGAYEVKSDTLTIAGAAFGGCASLKSIKIPDGVTSIGSSAFYECTSLTSIEIPNSVTSIGSSAFYECTSLKSVTIGSGVTSIGEKAFEYCTSLESVTIPDSVTSIGYYAFYGCTSLTGVTIGNGVTSIGDGAFDGCTALESVTIGSGVTSIGNGAFWGCTSLTEINYNATECEDFSSGGLFYNAGQSGKGITVNIGANVKKIPTYLFRNDSSTSPKIVSVVFADGSVCESIGSWAFAYCTSITSVTIGSGVTSIGMSAFSNCTSLNTVYYNGTANDWNKISIGSYNTKLTGATRYYYSESEPTTDGNYWHYNTDGVPVVWGGETATDTETA